MLLKLLFAFAATTTVSCSADSEIAADTLPCHPSNSKTTCILNYQTKSGGITPVGDTGFGDFTRARAYVYSPECLLLGRTAINVPMGTPVHAWGLSLSKPLVVGYETTEGIPFKTPFFIYEGGSYTYKDCSCQGSSPLADSRAEHRCACQFKCNMWVLD